MTYEPIQMDLTIQAVQVSGKIMATADDTVCAVTALLFRDVPRGTVKDEATSEFEGVSFRIQSCECVETRRPL